MLRRLDGLGRQVLIMKELETLPNDLPSLYSLMISDYQKHRTDEQLATLKKLFAWIAFSRRPLTLGEGLKLVSIVARDTSFRLEEEIDSASAG
jgi:hypothetical protein